MWQQSFLLRACGSNFSPLKAYKKCLIAAEHIHYHIIIIIIVYLCAPRGDEAECLGWRGKLFCQSGTRRGKVGWQGPGEEGKEEEGANLVMYILYFHSFSFSTVLCCWQQGWKEEKKERGEV